MAENPSYENLGKLSARIHAMVARLEQGKLSREELETLANISRELYERSIVLRHKAYDEWLKPPSKTPIVNPPSTQALLFQLEDTAIGEDGEEEVIPSNQTSLIDAIAEESHHEELDEALEERAHNLNDKWAQDLESAQTVASKLKAQPVNDLKKAIGLNQKFRFINELFGGEIEKYEQAILQLNNAESKVKALERIAVLQKELEWDEASKTTLQMYELIERRHS